MEVCLVDEQIKDLEFEVKEDEELKLSLACFEAFKNCEINVKVHKNGKIDAAFADFSKGSGALRMNVYLLEEGASASFHGACLCGGSDKKKIDASLIHEAPHTEGLVSNYGIAQEEGKLAFLGTSHLKHGTVSSSTRQEAKIIVFDPTSDGRCDPILKIDESDITASHAATVGKLNDDHLFYLLSRGLSEDKAKRLMIMGYLKPIIAHFPESMAERLTTAIEGGVAHD